MGDLFSKLMKQIGHKWDHFVRDLKKHADPDDDTQVFLDTFISISSKFGVRLSQVEQDNLLSTYPGRDEGPRKRINLRRLYDQQTSQDMKRIYTKVDINANENEDDAQDRSGYFGQFYRVQQNLEEMSEEAFYNVFRRNNKIVEIMRKIKEID